MKLKSNRAFIIKAKRANHMVRAGIYQSKADACEAFAKIPMIYENQYEIVEIRFEPKEGKA